MGIKCGYIGTIGYYLDKKIADLPNTSADVCDLYEMIINAYDNGFKHIVLEVSSQGLAYQRLEGIPFDYALFTNLTEDHLDYHKTMENYALAKQKLFYKLKETGIGIVNIDDEYCNYFKVGKYLTYGFNDSDYQVVKYHLNNLSTSFDIKKGNQLFSIKSPLIGKYNIYNVLGLIIILDLLNISKEKIESIIPALKSPNGRMDTIKYKNNSIIIDYAHTPDAMENIYNTVKEIAKGKIYTVFGCTGDRDRLKRPIMLSLATSNSDYSIVTMDDLHDEEFDHIVSDMVKGIEKNNFEICMDRGKAIEKGLSLLKENDILLILGKGHETSIIIKDKRIPFNDKECVKGLIDKVTV
jgi:UDP-N-acetylmuramoyl-L-alanyl-D-glutamate--2,6-diaminopimelate ligase